MFALIHIKLSALINAGKMADREREEQIARQARGEAK